MIETVIVPGQPMLYITTQTSNRSSSIASTIKLSLDQVSRFLDEQGVAPAGRPLAIFSDWNGRLVTIEAGYPVNEESLPFAAGRIMAGRTPHGQAVRSVEQAPPGDYVRRHEALLQELRAAGLRTSGTTWEIYRGNPAAENAVIELYAQLIATEARPLPT